jgi:hypothetical protein
MSDMYMDTDRDFPTDIDREVHTPSCDLRHVTTLLNDYEQQASKDSLQTKLRASLFVDTLLDLKVLINDKVNVLNSTHNTLTIGNGIVYYKRALERIDKHLEVRFLSVSFLRTGANEFP